MGAPAPPPPRPGAPRSLCGGGADCPVRAPTPCLAQPRRTAPAQYPHAGELCPLDMPCNWLKLRSGKERAGDDEVSGTWPYCRTAAAAAAAAATDDDDDRSCYVDPAALLLPLAPREQWNSTTDAAGRYHFPIPLERLLQSECGASGPWRRAAADRRPRTRSMAPLLLLLLPLAAAHVGAEGREAPPRYTRQWAVHVEGGPPAADAVAAKHGFVNLGQVERRGFQRISKRTDSLSSYRKLLPPPPPPPPSPPPPPPPPPPPVVQTGRRWP
ncbi:uncharacterized protein LOC126413182 [Schistocerca serialis cubense]|uniref:uncharacterized protein LOC126413182 n=1 Tax=Schistocerca serialis cubense TaxID=2023355 RepID=UPI00214E4905|nr:uncharacterized protein LOC126413182 [Schistocerca serialis cubense]